MGIIGSVLEKLCRGDTWKAGQRGPTLQKFFGGYGIQELWAAYRRYRGIDDGLGWLDYGQCQRVLQLPEHSQIFLWDVMAEQGALVNAKMCFTTVCVMSNSRLDEKGRFLMGLFDASCEGVITGTELAAICSTLCSVLSKCTGVPIQAKSVTAALKAELPSLIPDAYAEALKSKTIDTAFKSERCIGGKEFETLLSTLRPHYEKLPISEQLMKVYAPPPVKQQRNESDDMQAHPEPIRKIAGSGGAAVHALREKSVPVEMREEKKDKKFKNLDWWECLKDDLPTETVKQKKHTVSETIESQMRIHGKEFAEVAKDLMSFKRLFKRSLSSSLGVPAACIEVINVSAGGIIVDFRVTNSKDRSASAILTALEMQLQNKCSALRRSAFGLYAESAQLQVPGKEPVAPAVEVEVLENVPVGAATKVEHASEVEDLKAELARVLTKSESFEREIGVKVEHVQQELMTLRHQKDAAEEQVLNLRREVEMLRQKGQLVRRTVSEEVEFWRARAEAAEAKVEQLRADKAAAGVGSSINELTEWRKLSKDPEVADLPQPKLQESRPSTASTSASMARPSSALAQPSSHMKRPSSAMAPLSSSMTRPSSAMGPPSSGTMRPSSAMAPPSSGMTRPSSAMEPPSSSMTRPSSASTSLDGEQFFRNDLLDG